VAVVCLILSTSPVLDVVAITLFVLHDPMDSAWGAVLAIVVEATSKLLLFALTVVLVMPKGVVTSVTTAPVLVEVGA
jgi:hypothetical protein